MFLHDFTEAYHTIKSNSCLSDETTVLIISAIDCDAICACQILISILKADDIHFQLEPVIGIEDMLIRANEILALPANSKNQLASFGGYSQVPEDLSEDEDDSEYVVNPNCGFHSVIFINCGGTINPLDHILIPLHTTCYIIDSHRPLDLNIVSPDNKRVYVFSDNSPLDKVPKIDYSILEEDEEIEESHQSDEGKSPSNSPLLDSSDDDEPIEIEPETIRRKRERSHSPTLLAGIDEQVHKSRIVPKSKLSILMEEQDNARILRQKQIEMEQLIDSYYSTSYFGSPSAGILYTLAHQLSIKSKTLAVGSGSLNPDKFLWLTIVSLTHAYLHNQLSIKYYALWVNTYFDEVSLFNSTLPTPDIPETQIQHTIEENHTNSDDDDLLSESDDDDFIVDDLHENEILDEDGEDILDDETGDFGDMTSQDYFISASMPKYYSISIKKPEEEEERLASFSLAQIEQGEDVPSQFDAFLTKPKEKLDESVFIVPHADISFQKEFNIPMFRHWSLYDSVFHSPYFALHFRLWEQQGSGRINRFFAHLGLPLSLARAPFDTIPTRFKKQLPMRLSAAMEKYHLSELFYPSFRRRVALDAELNASDVVHATTALLSMPITSTTIKPNKSDTPTDIFRKHLISNFYSAFESIGSESFSDISKGIKLAQEMLKTQFNTVFRLVVSRRFQMTERFYYFQISDESTCSLFSFPQSGLRFALFLRQVLESLFSKHRGLVVSFLNRVTHRFLVIGLPHSSGELDLRGGEAKPLISEAKNNRFGKSFRQVSDISRAQVYRDNFDSSIIQVSAEKMKDFVDSLEAIVSQVGNYEDYS